jgi:hypothetical protein
MQKPLGDLSKVVEPYDIRAQLPAGNLDGGATMMPTPTFLDDLGENALNRPHTTQQLPGQSLQCRAAGLCPTETRPLNAPGSTIFSQSKCTFPASRCLFRHFFSSDSHCNLPLTSHILGPCAPYTRMVPCLILIKWTNQQADIGSSAQFIIVTLQWLLNVLSRGKRMDDREASVVQPSPCNYLFVQPLISAFLPRIARYYLVCYWRTRANLSDILKVQFPNDLVSFPRCSISFIERNLSRIPDDIPFQYHQQFDRMHYPYHCPHISICALFGLQVCTA